MSTYGVVAKHLRPGDVVSFQGLHRRISDVQVTANDVEADTGLVWLLFDPLMHPPAIAGIGDDVPDLVIDDEVRVYGNQEFLVHARNTARGIFL